MTKHVTYAEKSLLMSDEAADVLTRYASLLADRQRADNITLKGVSDDGNEVEATFVLDAGTNLMAETTHSSINPPEDDENIQVLKDKLASLEGAGQSRPYTDDELEEMPQEFVD